MIYDQIVAIVKANFGDADKAADEIIEMLQDEGILNSEEDEDDTIDEMIELKP